MYITLKLQTYDLKRGFGKISIGYKSMKQQAYIAYLHI